MESKATEERVSLLQDGVGHEQLAYNSMSSGSASPPLRPGPSAALRKSVKFWVLPSKFLAVKKRIAKFAPEWRFDNVISPSLAESGAQVNTIYFDTPDLRLYEQRITDLERAMLFRFRWYSSRPARDGYVEHECHQSKERHLPTIKQRFEMAAARVTDFMDRGPSAADVESTVSRSVYRYMKKFDDLKPKIRSSYRRTVFQDTARARVRISFDEDITLCDVKNLTWTDACDPDFAMPHYKVFHFPLGVLKVRLEYESIESIEQLRVPAVVQGMARDGMLVQVEKFSKYCTGCAVMNLPSVKVVPSWIAAVRTLMEIELASKGQEWFGVEKEPQWEIIQQNAVVIPQRVEPREYLANERTLLKWVRMCFLALFVGLALLRFEKTREPVTGVVLVAFALLILARAYFMYRRRLNMLITKNFEYDFYDRYGPFLILVLFVVPTLTYFMFCLGVFNVST